MLSSSSKHHPEWIHDVFVSFRGTDTRKNFVSYLYAALSNAGVNTFLDDEKLSKGGELELELLRAIEGSQISIVVFSKNYTDSRWCIDELVKIMECHRTTGQVVLPVFYDVDPSQVRYIGRLAGYLDVKEALIRAADLVGWDLKNYREQKLLKDWH